MQIQKRMWVYNKFLACIAAEQSFRGISSLTCCDAHCTHRTFNINIHLMCDAFVITQSGGQVRLRMRVGWEWKRKRKNPTMIFPFPVFQLWFVCCIRFLHSFHSGLSLTHLLRVKKPQMNWCGEIEDCAMFLFHFQIIFYCFLPNNHSRFFCLCATILLWFSRVYI